MTDEQLPYETLRENSILLFEALEHSMTEPEGVRLRLPKRDRKARRIQPARTALLFGYAAHVLGLTGTVIELLDKNRVLEATPIVRSGYETALQSQWLYLVENDAACALANEHGRLRRAMKNDASESGSAYLMTMADEIADADWQDLPTDSREQAKSMSAMLKDLEAGNELYVYYRLMSEYCHPSMTIVDQYIHSHNEDEPYPRFQYEPKQPSRSTWMFFMLLSACLAAYPVSTLMRDKNLRNTIRRIGRECSVNFETKLSAKYAERMRKARQDREAESTSADQTRSR